MIGTQEIMWQVVPCSLVSHLAASLPLCHPRPPPCDNVLTVTVFSSCCTKALEMKFWSFSISPVRKSRKNCQNTIRTVPTRCLRKKVNKMCFGRKVCLSFLAAGLSGFWSPEEKPGCCPAPSITSVASCPQVWRMLTVSRHNWLSHCCCGVQAHDGIWEKMNMTVRAHDGQTLGTGSIKSKRGWDQHRNERLYPRLLSEKPPGNLFLHLTVQVSRSPMHLLRECQVKESTLGNKKFSS